jgi:hypothetical protein
MLVLDTDHVSILQQQTQPAYQALRTRLALQPPAEIFISIVSFQEQVQGWLASPISSARKSALALWICVSHPSLLQWARRC